MWYIYCISKAISVLDNIIKLSHLDRKKRKKNLIFNTVSKRRLAPLFIPEDPCPRTGRWSPRTGPRTGVLGNGKHTY